MTIIKSNTGKKEAEIRKIYGSYFNYAVFVNQLSNTGIDVEKDLLHCKTNFKTLNVATKWALQNLN